MPEPDSLESRVQPLLTPLLELYLDLHRHPELSGQERRPPALLAQRLAAAGYTVTTGIGGHGVLGVLRNGDGPTVLLRTELDALPLTERTGLAYASVPPSGGGPGVMHACGHDAHIACAVGAANLLVAGADRWRGTVMVLGQPAEEDLSGAAAMVADGLRRHTGRPDVILAQHLTPLPAGLVAHTAGPVTAASLTLELRVHGRGGHAGLPQLATDPVPVAAAIVLDLAAMQAAMPVVVTVGAIHGGSRANIIPDLVTLSVSLRAQTDAVLRLAVAELSRIAERRCALAGCPRGPELVRLAGSPAGVNDPAAAELVRAAHQRAFGAGRMTVLPPSMATDDFPLLAEPDSADPVPTVYWMLGSVGRRDWAAAPGPGAAEKLAALPANHSAGFAPDPVPTLRTGTAAMTAAALALLAPGRSTRCQPPASALSALAPVNDGIPAS